MENQSSHAADGRDGRAVSERLPGTGLGKSGQCGERRRLMATNAEHLGSILASTENTCSSSLYKVLKLVDLTAKIGFEV
jgi:hypothetical protein